MRALSGADRGSSAQPAQSDQATHHHKRNRQGGDAADVPGQATQVVVSEVGNEPQPGVKCQGGGAGEQQQLDAHQHPGEHLDGQGREPQRLEDLLEGADLGCALCSQGPWQHPQIQHQMATGPHRGGQGMNNHQQRKHRHGSDRAAASTMGAIRQE